MLVRSLAERIPPQNIVRDTDLQRTATEFLSKNNPEINVEFLPITPAFENTNIFWFNNSLNRMNSDLDMLQLLTLLLEVHKDFGI